MDAGPTEPHLTPAMPVATLTSASDRPHTAALLQYYEAIETASREMPEAARTGDWDRVVKLEGACAVLISQLQHAATGNDLGREEVQVKARIMQRILLNDAEIRHLAEPWLEDLDQMMAGRPRNVLH
jgi:flagellar protein FliT